MPTHRSSVPCLQEAVQVRAAGDDFVWEGLHQILDGLVAEPLEVLHQPGRVPLSQHRHDVFLKALHNKQMGVTFKKVPAVGTMASVCSQVGEPDIKISGLTLM